MRKLIKNAIVGTLTLAMAAMAVITTVKTPVKAADGITVHVIEKNAPAYEGIALNVWGAVSVSGIESVQFGTLSNAWGEGNTTSVYVLTDSSKDSNGNYTAAINVASDTSSCGIQVIRYNSSTDQNNKQIDNSNSTTIGTLLSSGASDLWLTVDYESGITATTSDPYATTSQDVIDAIDAIGTVTLDSEDAICNAEALYNSLNDDDKASVTNYDKLTAAKAAYADLYKEMLMSRPSKKLHFVLSNTTIDSIGVAINLWNGPYSVDGIRIDSLSTCWGDSNDTTVYSTTTDSDGYPALTVYCADGTDLSGAGIQIINYNASKCDATQCANGATDYQAIFEDTSSDIYVYVDYQASTVTFSVEAPITDDGDTDDGGTNDDTEGDKDLGDFSAMIITIVLFASAAAFITLYRRKSSDITE